MKCPFCAYRDSKVIDSRSSDGGMVIRRRRECKKCKSRFTTFERYEQIPSLVIKRNGDKEPYKREKILIGLRKALEKRPVTRQQIEELLEGVESELRMLGEREVKTSQIGRIVLKKLKEMDEVAYLRFASVYKGFKDVSQFQEELGELMKKEKE
jgi:transcriptional repressor NrdR